MTNLKFLPLITVGAILSVSLPMAYAADPMNDGINRTGTVTTTTSVSTPADWNTENTYWRNAYPNRPYYSSANNYTTYEPAYQYGVTAYNQSQGKRYEDLNQSELRRGWDQARGDSNLTWDQAQNATRDAYSRLYTNQTASTSRGGSASDVSSSVNNMSNVAPAAGTTSSR